MADQFDRATEQEELTRSRELAAQQDKAAAAPKYIPRGHCLNPKCGDDFAAGDNRLFCDSRCAVQHQRFSNH